MIVRAQLCRPVLCVLLALPFAACSGMDFGSSSPDSLGSESGQAPAGGEAEPSSPTTRTIVKHTLPVVDDVVRQPGGLLSRSGATLVVEPPATALLAFEGPGLEPDCIESASLRVHAVQAEAPVEAWVSLETEVSQVPEGASLGRLVIADGSPTTTATAKNGTLTVDVTEHLRWSRIQQQSPFFVLALKTTFFRGTADPRLELGAMETNEGAVVEVVERSPCE
jgi:hypothetical protein